MNIVSGLEWSEDLWYTFKGLVFVVFLSSSPRVERCRAPKTAAPDLAGLGGRRKRCALGRVRERARWGADGAIGAWCAGALEGEKSSERMLG